MRSLKSGLAAIAISSVCGLVAVAGCSADGGGAVAGDEADAGNGSSVVPPRGDDTTIPAKDGGTTTKKDSGTKPVDSGVDAGPPPPVEGDPCTNLNSIGKKPCGACGTAETVCLADGDAGGGKWSTYGTCNGELVGGCTPGTQVQEDCGNCGKVTKTCTQFCAYISTACTGQPANSCSPGTIEYTTAGCTPSQYRNRTCSATCMWSGFSATCATPVNEHVLAIGATVGTTTSLTVPFSAAKQGPKLSGFSACPQAGNLTAGDYPYQYIEIKNPTAKAATVTVYASDGGSGVIDTIMAGYSTAIQPMDDAAKKACAYGANDQSSSDVALTGNSDFSILKAIPIPAGASMLIYVASYYKNPTSGEITTGNLKINAKVDTLL